jgi:tryptophan synthase alpha subunit
MNSIEEIGWSPFLTGLCTAGMDGLVISDLGDPELLERVADHGISPIPLIRHGTTSALASQLEAKARHLAYRTLALQTGTPLELATCTAAARMMRAAAVKPYLLGFGLRYPFELRTLAPYADGFVIGSELLRRIQQKPERYYACWLIP